MFFKKTVGLTFVLLLLCATGSFAAVLEEWDFTAASVGSAMTAVGSTGTGSTSWTEHSPNLDPTKNNVTVVSDGGTNRMSWNTLVAWNGFTPNYEANISTVSSGKLMVEIKNYSHDLADSSSNQFTIGLSRTDSATKTFGQLSNTFNSIADITIKPDAGFTEVTIGGETDANIAGTNIAATTLTSAMTSGSDYYDLYMELDLDSNTYEIFQGKNGGTVSSIGTGTAGDFSVESLYMGVGVAGDSTNQSANLFNSVKLSSEDTTTATWEGGGGDTNFSTRFNWEDNFAPTSSTTTTIKFADTTDTTVNLDANFSTNTVEFTSDATSHTLSSSTSKTLTLESASANITQSSSNAQEISANIALSNAVTVQGSGTGDVTLSGVVSGANGLTKTGSNFTLKLSGANTYTGNTTVTGGTLMLGASERVSNASTLVLSGGTFDLNGFSETFNGLTLAANSTIDFSTVSGNSILTFLGTVTGLDTYTLTLLNWDGVIRTGGGNDQIIFSGDTLTGTELNNILTYSDNGSDLISDVHSQLAGGEVVPVPEPSTWITGGLLGMAMLWQARRRYLKRKQAAQEANATPKGEAPKNA